MAAPKGNEFWKQRSRHGRHKTFATPELLWEAACEYFEWCEKNPIKDPRSFGQRKIQRPFTMQGLCLYLGCNSAFFRRFKSDLTDSEIDQDFRTIVNRIEDTIYMQKLENAMIGVYKENIVARDLALRDDNKTELSGQIGVTWNEQKTYETKPKTD